MTNTEMATILAPLEAAFQKHIPEDMGVLYYEVLGQLDPAAVKAAVLRYIYTNESQFLPAPALLLRYADEAAHGVEMAADEAIKLVWDAVRKHHGYDTDCHRAACADLGPKIWDAMKAAGGYQRFCDCESGDKASLTAQFRDAWNANVRREEQSRRLPAALVPRVNGPNHQLRIEATGTPRLVAQGVD